MISADIAIVLPELLLSLYAMAALLVAVYTSKDAGAPLLIWVTAGVFVLVAVWMIAGGTDGTAFGGSFVADTFSRFAKAVILLSAAAVLVMGQDYMARNEMMRFEYPIIVTLAVIGMMIMVSAGDLMVLYLGLELQSLALYVVAAFRRDNVKSTEAGLKYFVLGALSSGMLLYGASLVYGFSGTTNFAGIAGVVEGSQHLPLGLLFGLVFLIAGLAFKISAVPFHMWTPDVYEGAPSPVTALFATAPKVAAIVLFARLLHGAFAGVEGDWGQIIAFLALASMFLGAFGALMQTDIKRLMAYSSIAHMGYAMMGLAAGTELGVKAMLVYIAIYVTMNIGMFAFILSMERDGRPVTDIASLRLYSKVEPLKALALLVLLFSLAGVPPFLGFFGKLYVVWAAVDAGRVWLAVLGVIASVIGAFYYLRIVYFMYFGEEGRSLDSRMPAVQWALLMGAAAIMLVGIINLFGVESWAATAAQALVR